MGQSLQGIHNEQIYQCRHVFNQRWLKPQVKRCYTGESFKGFFDDVSLSILATVVSSRQSKGLGEHLWRRQSFDENLCHLFGTIEPICSADARQRVAHKFTGCPRHPPTNKCRLIRSVVLYQQSSLVSRFAVSVFLTHIETPIAPLPANLRLIKNRIDEVVAGQHALADITPGRERF